MHWAKLTHTILLARLLFSLTPAHAVEFTWRLRYTKCEFLLTRISRGYSYRLVSATSRNHQNLIQDGNVVRDVSSTTRRNSQRKRIDVVMRDHLKEEEHNVPQVWTVLQDYFHQKFTLRTLTPKKVQIDYTHTVDRSKLTREMQEKLDSDETKRVFESLSYPTLFGAFSKGDWQSFLNGEDVEIKIHRDSVEDLIDTIILRSNNVILLSIWEHYFNTKLTTETLVGFDFHIQNEKYGWILYGDKYELRLQQVGAVTIEAKGTQ